MNVQLVLVQFDNQLAAVDPYIKGLYYVRSKAGVQASKNTCVACEG